MKLPLWLELLAMLVILVPIMFGLGWLVNVLERR